MLFNLSSIKLTFFTKDIVVADKHQQVIDRHLTPIQTHISSSIENNTICYSPLRSFSYSDISRINC